jgi:hypothetical protein
MPNLYEVHLSNGQVYEVSTQHHHDDHPAPTFQQHLLDVLKSSASRVVSEVIIRVVFKGRR